MCQVKAVAIQAIEAAKACAGAWHPALTRDADIMIRNLGYVNKLGEGGFAEVMDWVSMAFKVIQRDSERAAESDEN